MLQARHFKGKHKHPGQVWKRRIDETKTRFKTSSIPQRTQQIGLGQKQVPNFNDIFQQQKRQQQIEQQQMEEEMEHGMSM